MNDDKHAARYGGDSDYEVVKVLEAHGVTSNAFLYDAMVYLFRLGKKGDRLRDLGAAINYLQRLERVWKSGHEVGDGSIHDWQGGDERPTFDDAVRAIEERADFAATPQARSALDAAAAKLRTMKKRQERRA